MSPQDVNALPATKPVLVQNYGRDPLQIGELRLPAGKGPFPVAVVIHGGCWTKGFATLRMTAPIASALAAHGVATWNIEYRQIGDAGAGWPGTFRDWASALDHVRILARAYPLDSARVVTVGHSAGGHAALWLAARPRLAKDSEIRGDNPLSVFAAVAIDGPGDISGFVGLDAQICGKPVIAPLMGGTPAEQPDRYRQASPQSLLPLGVPQFLITATVLAPAAATEYQRLGLAGGDRIVILNSVKNHFEVIAPGRPAWDEIQRLILERAVGTKPARP